MSEGARSEAWQPHPVRVPLGVYQHYKGACYRVLFQAWESTNGRARESLVVYVSQSAGTINVRTTAEFVGVVGESGVRRFKPLLLDEG